MNIGLSDQPIQRLKLTTHSFCAFDYDEPNCT